MEGSKNVNDSFSEIKIYKPKAVRVYKNSQKSLKTSLSSSTSTLNSEINMNQFYSEETKADLENISIEEINTDFFIYGQYLEEEECHEELNGILNNSGENEEASDNKGESEPKIKRCENPLKTEIEDLQDDYFDDLIKEIDNIYSGQNEEKDEK